MRPRLLRVRCAGGTFDELHRARLRGEALPLHLRDIDAALARPPTPPGFAPTNHGTLLIYSASIELKRISFLDKAIRHAAACDANEVLALAAAMHTVNARWKDRFA